MATVSSLSLPPRVSGELTGDLRLVFGGFSGRSISDLPPQVSLQFLFWGQEGPPVTAHVPVVEPNQIPSALNAVAAELAGTLRGPDAPDVAPYDAMFPLCTDDANFASYLTDMVRMVMRV
jgi:hypothetical protein